MINEEFVLEQMVVAVENSFNLINQRSKADEKIGYAIVTDDSASSFTPFASTKNGLERLEVGDANNFRFNPENWDLSADIEDLKTINSFLTELEKECEDYENDEHWHEEYRTRVYHLAVRTLETLKVKGNFHDDQFLVVWVVDSDVPNYRATSWVKRLNNSQTYLSFVKWLNPE